MEKWRKMETGMSGEGRGRSKSRGWKPDKFIFNSTLVVEEGLLGDADLAPPSIVGNTHKNT